MTTWKMKVVNPESNIEHELSLNQALVRWIAEESIEFCDVAASGESKLQALEEAFDLVGVTMLYLGANHLSAPAFRKWADRQRQRNGGDTWLSSALRQLGGMLPDIRLVRLAARNIVVEHHLRKGSRVLTKHGGRDWQERSKDEWRRSTNSQ